MFYRSLGCTGDNEGRAKFDAFVRTLAAGAIPEGYADYAPTTPPPLTLQMPMGSHGATLYDFLFDRSTQVCAAAAFCIL